MDKEVLLVDSNSSVRQSLSQFIEEKGYRVTESDNIKNAMKIAQEKSGFTFIVLDIHQGSLDVLINLKELMALEQCCLEFILIGTLHTFFMRKSQSIFEDLPNFLDKLYVKLKNPD
jgi:DNA-binding NtrC family response regulator